MDDDGYDDQFNEGLFRTTIHNSACARPGKWPKSVSEMRAHTDYAPQGMPQNGDVDHQRWPLGRTAPPYYTQPAFYRSPWTDPASPTDGVWNGYIQRQYWDPMRGWIWVDDSTTR